MRIGRFAQTLGKPLFVLSKQINLSTRWICECIHHLLIFVKLDLSDPLQRDVAPSGLHKGDALLVKLIILGNPQMVGLPCSGGFCEDRPLPQLGKVKRID